MTIAIGGARTMVPRNNGHIEITGEVDQLSVQHKHWAGRRTVDPQNPTRNINLLVSLLNREVARNWLQE